jgi:hypothetical protein
MKNEQPTQLVLAGGEWFSSLLTAFQTAELELTAKSDRAYQYRFASIALPHPFFDRAQ